MGARILCKQARRGQRHKGEVRAFALTFAAIVGPMVLACFLIAADIRTDLSELRPRPVTGNSGAPVLPEALLIGWPDLAPSLGRVSLLGYMMDGYAPRPEGSRAEMFILMPEAGHLLHPAHREPAEMIEVYPAADESAVFRYRSLVRVSGILTNNPGPLPEGHAFWKIDAASVRPAGDGDIGLFAP